MTERRKKGVEDCQEPGMVHQPEVLAALKSKFPVALDEKTVIFPSWEQATAQGLVLAEDSIHWRSQLGKVFRRNDWDRGSCSLVIAASWWTGAHDIYEDFLLVASNGWAHTAVPGNCISDFRRGFGMTELLPNGHKWIDYMKGGYLISRKDGPFDRAHTYEGEHKLIMDVLNNVTPDYRENFLAIIK